MVTQFVDKMNQKFRKKHDKDVIFTGDDERFKIKKIPTGILSLDILTMGGIPIGRWTEIYGHESLLKTSIALYTIANAQRLGFPCMYVNVERNITKDLLKIRGVNTSPDMLTVAQADVAEEYLEIIKEAMHEEVYKVIVLDSIAALFPRREFESKADSSVGAQGLFTSKMGRVLTASNDNSTALILVNQTREKIGISFGDPTTRPGGKAPRFYDSLVIRLTQIGKDMEATHPTKKGRGYRKMTGIEIAVEIEKTKAGGRMGAETVLHYDVQNHKIDHAQEIIVQGQLYGVVIKEGRLLRIGNTKMFEKQWIEKINKSKKATRTLQTLILEQATKEE